MAGGCRGRCGTNRGEVKKLYNTPASPLQPIKKCDMAQSKFNGFCVLVASLIVAAALVYHAQKTTVTPTHDQPLGRYQVSASDRTIIVIDTTNGTIVNERRWAP